MKEKHFRRCNLLDVTAKVGLSWIWKSLISAKDLFLKGIKWQVGNGAKIKIWKDKWLPTPSTYKIHSPIKNLHRHISSLFSLSRLVLLFELRNFSKTSIEWYRGQAQIYLVKWDNLCIPIDSKGLGIRNMRNLTMRF